MSYILDALQRADAQRQRGAVPDLHVRQVLIPTPPNPAGVAARAGWITAIALLLGCLSAGLWIWKMQADSTQVASAVPASSQEPQKIIAAPPALIAAAPAKASAPEVPPPAVVNIGAPATPLPMPTPKPIVSDSESRVAQPPPKVDAKVDTKAHAATVDVSPPETTPLLSDLPEHIRSQIPPLTITGAVYSQDPGQRLLLINAQVLAQGSQAAPEVSLVEIRARSSEFSFRGTRFRLAH